MKRFVVQSLLTVLAALVLNNTFISAPVAADEDHGGDIVYTKPVKAVIFSHKAHAEDLGMQCEWCHDETFEMEALAVETSGSFNMESLCNENYCGTCHNGDVAFATTVQCARCHIGERGYNRLVKEGKITPEKGDAAMAAAGEQDPGKPLPKFDVKKAREKKKDEEAALEKMIDAGYFPEEIVLKEPAGKSSAVFSHKDHIAREKTSCTQCHPYVFLMKADNKVVKQRPMTMEQMNKGEYCGTCHNGDKAFDVADESSCEICHPAK